MPATIKRGDTWPPLRMTLSDDDGPIDFSTADAILVLIKTKNGTTLISGPGEAIDPAFNDGYNLQWAPAAGDTDLPSEYSVEAQVTWDAASVPPKVETIPNKSEDTLTIRQDLGP